MGNEAACNPHAASISSPPSFRRGLLIHPPSIGGILSNNDGAAHNPHLPPHLTSFTPLFGGNVFNLIKIFDVLKIN